ncbi:magnesium chelatase subunit D [Hydrogenophaga sp. XSHU_21]
MNTPLGANATLAAALCAVDPVGLGGVVLRGPHSPLRDAWLTTFRDLLPESSPWLRLPHHAGESALLGGLDLAATLQAGRPVAQRGLLARAHGGALVLPMAERTAPGNAALLAHALDTGQVSLQRDGLSLTAPATFALIALDEGEADDERLCEPLLDRLAFALALRPASENDTLPSWTREDIATARAALTEVRVPDHLVQALCAAAAAWGIASLRAPLLAVRVARAAAALAGLDEAGDTEAALAANLVLAHRATRLPTEPEAEAEPEPPPEQAPEQDTETEPPTEDQPAETAQLDDRLIDAIQAALPEGLLAALQAGQQRGAKARAQGTAGALMKHAKRGRPVGSRRSDARDGARLHLLDTLRAAAPWQRLRQRTASAEGGARRIEVRREDFHVQRLRQRRPSTTVFVVDASGSAALHRLAEAKGAVELLLADCYVRRDQVAVLAFRGAGADLLLPPTRSLARAKRALGALPGGGGTPLAAGIDAARELAQQIARRGESPLTVFLTDGRANIARDGTPGRSVAALNALESAQAFAALGLTALVIDTSPQPADPARELAAAMAAAYLPLPHAGAQGLSRAVQLAQAH